MSEANPQRAAPAYPAANPNARPLAAPPASPPGAPAAVAGTPVRRARLAPLTPAHWAIFGLIVALGFWLRLNDALSSSIMGAEDPYRHMERTWELMSGEYSGGYPPGLAILMVPFALMGPGVFYTVARFLPAVFGAVMVTGVFLLTKRYLQPAGALTSAILAATMPEAIQRTNILFPTGVDLAILPFFFLVLLRATELRTRKAAIQAAVFAPVFLLFHPWVLGLLTPTVAIFLAVTQSRDDPKRRAMWIALPFGVILLGALVSWNGAFTGISVGNIVAGFGRFMANPNVFAHPPLYVDLQWMLTIPALILAAAGAIVAVVRRTRFQLLAILWAGTLLPFILFDWFDVWYLPHRTVAYFSVGVAMLAGIPVSEIFTMMSESRPKAQTGATLGVVALALLVTVPAGAAMQPWYRIYDDHAFDAWKALDERNAEYVQAGSWEARMGYRATTGREANYNPDFFRDATVRDFELRNHPDMVVLIDNYTVEPGPQQLPTEFLASWQQIGSWGSYAAYIHPH